MPSNRRVASLFRCGASLALVVPLLTIAPSQANEGTRKPLSEAVAACRITDLALAYAGGQPATGSFFAQVTVWNTGPESCLLEGVVRLVGTYKGKPDTNVLSYGIVPDLVLTPRRDSAPLWSSPRGGEIAAAIPIESEYRDDPNVANGLCSAHRIVPADWLVSIGGTSRTVADWNPSNTAWSHDFLTCSGRIVNALPRVQRYTAAGFNQRPALVEVRRQLPKRGTGVNPPPNPATSRP